MMSYPLIGYCFTLAGIYLFISSLALTWIGKLIKLNDTIPEEMREPSGVSWFFLNLFMEFLFLVAVPTLAYSFFEVVLPLAGIRVAAAICLVAVMLGAVPTNIALWSRVKLSMPLLVFSIMSLLIKLGGSLAIIGYLFSL
jgi:hypothetical protein